MTSLFADKATTRQRMALCQACEHATGGNRIKFFCGQCGCVLAGITRIAGEQCPVGKWSPSTNGAKQ